MRQGAPGARFSHPTEACDVFPMGCCRNPRHSGSGPLDSPISLPSNSPQNVLPAWSRSCSRIGPRLTAGKKVSADRGVDIDDLDKALIFDKFYRGQGQRFRIQGTGTGLAIVKAIIEAHGGQVEVTSQRGLGSVFSFTLPRT